MHTSGISFKRVLIFLLAAGLLLGLAAPWSAQAASRSAPALTTSVSGVVRDGTSGGHSYPLYARIVFSSPSVNPFTVFSDPFSGGYHANLALNELTSATITPMLAGYPAATVSFTPSSNPFTINFAVSADLTSCSAPGYTNKIQPLFETFDSATPPALPGGWAMSQVGTGSTASWATTSSSAHPTGITPFSAPTMAVFNSYSASSGHAAMLHTTASSNVSSFFSATISFWMYHDSSYTSTQDKVRAVVSTDGSVYSVAGSDILRYSAVPGWVYHQVDISSYAGSGKPAVYIGLLGTSDWGNDIYIDDIGLGGCQKIAGGLVAGFVNGTSSGQPIVSATLANIARPAELTYSLSRGDDPALHDGFYELFSAGTGSQTYSASALRYLGSQQTVNVAAESVARLDLALASARLSASPNPVVVTMAVGGTGSLPLVISNNGALNASFTIQPAASQLTSGSTLASAIPYREEADRPENLSRDQVPAELAAAGRAASAGSGYEPQGGGPRQFGVAAPFPGVAGYRFASASCNGEDFYVFGGQHGTVSTNEAWLYRAADQAWAPRAPMPHAAANMRAACIDGKIYLAGGFANGVWNNLFQIYDTQTNSWTSTTQPVTGAPLLASYNGLLYALGGINGGDASDLASVYNPATGNWTALANLPTAASYAGVVVYQNKIFVIGGVYTADVQMYSPFSNSWDDSGPDLPGARMDPAVGWYGDTIYLLNGGGNGGNFWNPYPEGYFLNPAAWPGGAWTAIASPLPNPQVASASVCANNRLWSVGGTNQGTENHASQYYDSGLMCNHTYPSVPWLSAAPAASTVAAGGPRTVTLGLSANSTPYNSPGVYQAVLKLNSDAPLILADIPLTMVVVQTSPYLSIVPQSAILTVYPNKYAAYNFAFTNKTGSIDDFTIYAVGISSGWTGIINGGTSITGLINNGTSAVSIKLYPSATAKEGDEGVLTLGIRVHDNASRFVTFTSIARFTSYHLMVPYVAK